MKTLFITAFILTMTATSALAQVKGTKVLIHTDYGDIKLVLYNDTPQHRDNFIKLAKDGFYNGSIFHRVINGFMIQGGGAPQGKAEVDYRIPAEIRPNHIHKKGALAAARMGDNVNPAKESSGSQFYIVQGTVIPAATLVQYSQQTGIKFTPEQIKAYSTVGGSPHLDGGYTVFGEVIEGLNVVDKIAAVATGPGDKPLTDVKMTVKVLK